MPITTKTVTVKIKLNFKIKKREMTMNTKNNSTPEIEITYWSYFSRFNNEIVNTFNKLQKEKFVLIDGGAAGNLSSPFDIARSVIKAVRFEPRGDDEVELSSNDIYIDGGIWSEDKEGLLHVAEDPTTSSICPPNIEFLSQFNDLNGVPPRKTIKEIHIPLRSIDSCVELSEIPKPHFIKLDVHSAEVPALLGSKNSLDNCVGLLVETWNSEVHKGQMLHYDVEKFAIENGFEVYDNICAASWRIKHDGKVNDHERARYIGSEILFIKKNVPKELRLEKAFVLSLFGFYSAAQNLLQSFEIEGEKDLYDEITNAKVKASRPTLKTVLRKIYHLLKRFF